MLKSHLKIAWRSFIKNKTSSFINMSGLALGMTVAILICLWIWDELSFNHYHKNYKRIAIAMSIETINGATTAESFASVPLAGALNNSFPGDFKNSSLIRETSQVLKTDDKSDKIITQTGMWVQEGFTAMFTFKPLKGSLNVLKDPSAILLSQSAAKALFADADPINQTIFLSDKTPVKVAGVYEDIPDNSSFGNTQFLLSWYNNGNPGTQLQDDWLDHHYQLYMELNDNAGFDKTSAKIRDITKPHIKGAWEEIMLHPMDKWLLYNKFENGKMVAGRMQFIWLFGIICGFVLLIACINYMNLSTARSEKRAREVGIRKVLGSLHRQLIAQFLGESLVVTFAALIISVIAAQLALSWFNNLAGKNMSIPYAQPQFWWFLSGFSIFTALIAGSYPALYLSGFKASKVLKGTFKTGRAGSMARKVLVVIQFTVSITLITGTIIVFRQIQFAKDRPVGYTREGLITVNMRNESIKEQFDILQNDLLKTGVVKSIAASSSPSTAVQNSMIGYDWEGRDPNSVPIIGTLFVNQEFGKTIGWSVTDGRDFSKDYPADSGAFILNEAAVRFTGLKSPVGKTIRWHGRENPIIGVVKDMVMESPYMPVEPVFFTLSPNSRIHVITMRINPSSTISNALNKIAPVFKKYNPGVPFEYQFTDETYNRKFTGEEQVGRLASVFAVFAILISCLGMFGLASFIAEQRTKEIGVRKVLGASVLSIWQLLSREFLQLIAISLLISVPIAVYFMNGWLQNYVYRTSLSWWIFAVTGVAALLITLLTVSYQAIKAAVANPVKSLRSE
ncbi:MAG: ABC transporter permease [Bacteroidota bacterium]